MELAHTDPKRRSTVTVRTVLLFLAALAASEAAAQSRPPAWRLERDLHIGSVDGGESALTDVEDLAVGMDGSIYVLQPVERTVRVFGRDGRFLRRLGRRGRGPGEFERPTRLGLLRDTLWVADSQLRRVTFFAQGARLAGTLPLASPRTSPPYAPNVAHALMSDGSALATPSLAGMSLERGRVPLLRLDRQGRVLDTLAWRSTAHTALMLEARNTSIVSSFQPFRAALLTDVDPSGSTLVLVERPVAVGPGRAQFRVTRLAAGGDTVFSRRYHYTPRPVTRDLADSLVSMAARDVRQAYPSQQAAEAAVRAALYLPRFQPPVTAVVAGSDGTVWLRREEFGSAAVEWLVLDARGEIAGTFRAPKELRLFVAQRGTAWGVVPDELDVPHVVRYRVTAALASR